VIITKGKSAYDYFYSRLRASGGQWLPPFERLEDSKEWRAASRSYTMHTMMRFSGVVK